MLSQWMSPAALVVAELLFTLGQIQVVLLVIAPLWLLLYLRVRSLCEARQSQGLLVWLRGILAWGIVATHAQVSPRYAPVARWRLFWALNGVVVIALGFYIRPDFGLPLACFVALSLLAQALMFAIRRPHAF